MSRGFIFLVTLLAIICVSVEDQCNPGQHVYDKCRRLCVCGKNNTLTQCTRQRKEFTTMSSEERRWYIRTVKTASTDPRYKEEYDALITLHIQAFMSGIHNMDTFLPWHRWYLLQFENLLRKIDCRVTLPYWDWSIVSGEPWGTDREDLWYSGSTGFGGDGDSTKGYCVSTGPFAYREWQLVPAANPSCLRRRFYGNPPDSVAVAELLDTDPANFTDFEVCLRVNIHDTIHCLIGGTMCSLDASSAPEFFLHHAMVDKIWADWQSKSEEHKTVYFKSITEPMPAAYGMLAVEVLDNNALPGGIRVDYLEVNNTDTASLIKNLRKLSPKKLRKIPRLDFNFINEESLKLFRVDLEDVIRARREEKRFRPKYVIQDRQSLLTHKARKLGLAKGDVANALNVEQQKNLINSLFSNVYEE